MGSTKESGSNQESGDGTPQRLGCVQICSLVLHHPFSEFLCETGRAVCLAD